MKKFLLGFKDNYFIDSDKSDKSPKTQIDQTLNSKEIFTFKDIEEIFIDTSDIAIQTEDYQKIDISTQTIEQIEDNKLDIKIENDKLKAEIIKLKTENNRLIADLKEVTLLVHSLIKVNPKHPEIGNIKANLAVIVNREIRTKSPFPFIQL